MKYDPVKYLFESIDIAGTREMSLEELTLFHNSPGMVQYHSGLVGYYVPDGGLGKHVIQVDRLEYGRWLHRTYGSDPLLASSVAIFLMELAE